MPERLEPVIPESREVQLQAYLEVIDRYCAALAAETNTPPYLISRKDAEEFGIPTVPYQAE